MSDAMDQKHQWMRINQKILNCINANKIDLIRWFVAKDESLFQCYEPISNKKTKKTYCFATMKEGTVHDTSWKINSQNTYSKYVKIVKLF